MQTGAVQGFESQYCVSRAESLIQDSAHAAAFFTLNSFGVAFLIGTFHLYPGTYSHEFLRFDSY